MTLRAGCATVDITPTELPVEKPGWIVKILADRVDDPLSANVVVLEVDGGTRVAFVSLDILSIRWPDAERIRAIGETLGIPRRSMMVAATHTHTGPPASSPGLARRDEAYVTFMVERVAEAIGRAVASLAPARIAIDSGIEARVSSIRRCIMKEGSVKTHAPPTPAIRCAEGVIDPEVGVMCVRDAAGDRTRAMIVNFACHPVHGGGGTALSAGWPGVMRNEIRRAIGDDAVMCFLNGALGDAHHQSSLVPNYVDTKERVGDAVAESALRVLPGMKFSDDVKIAAAASVTIRIPLRDIDGPYGVEMKHRQRFAKDDVYELLIERLREKKRRRDHVLAEVQAIRVGDAAFVSLPCEPFTAIGLEIKRRSPIAKTYVVGCANGMIGYVPTEAAFEGGGYETTISMGSKLDPSAARLLTDAALDVLQRII